MKRLALRIAFALTVALVAAEVSLQLASLVARTVSGRGSVAGAVPDDEVATILCVGDSHTYGLSLPQERSYPAQLETALAARHPERAFQVVNLGIPGVDSGYVVERLQRQMVQLSPAVVVVWVGVNNQWRTADAEAGSAVRRWLFHSRLFRLASIGWYTRTGHQYDPQQYGGWYEGETPPPARPADAGKPMHPAPGLARDLARMADTAESLDTPIVFVTYPMRQQRPLNREIEHAAFERGVPLIDGIRELERAVHDGHAIPALIDRSAGPHPTGLLYRYFVESLVPAIEEALGLPLTAPSGGG
jgi:hypothetical protein